MDGQSPYRVLVTAAVSPPAGSAMEASRLYQVGVAHLQANDLSHAELAFRQALSIDRDLAAAHSHLGIVLQALQRTDEGVQHFERALALEPGDVGTLNNFGNALLALGRPNDAIRQYEKALVLVPGMAEVHVNLANALHAAKRHEEAFHHYRKALALDPGFARAHMNLGNSFKDLDRYEEAITCYEQALAIRPGYVVALMNLGKTVQMVDRREQAIECYKKVLAFEPANAAARWNLGALYLSLGRLTEGWEHYEMRWAAEGHVAPRAYSQPRWNGERLGGALLVWGDQGIGDQILHAGMIPELMSWAASIVLEVEPRLVPLFERSFPTLRVVGLRSDLYAGRMDAHAPLGGLGRFLRPTMDAFPRREHGYLVADDVRVRELRERLATDRQAVVGLSWISRNPEFGRFRSARLQDFSPLLKLRGCRFVDLQYGDTEAERAAIKRETGIEVERLDDVDTTNDIDRLAALISACDFVVTVDNTTVHLAGALGKSTWVLVPHGHARIWYWFDGRDDSPWYPRVRVRCQLRGQAWQDLMVSVASEVARSIDGS